MNGFFKWLELYMRSACLDENEYIALRDRIECGNRKNLQIFSAVALVFLGIMIVVSIFNELAHYNLAAYGGTTIIMAAIYVSSRNIKGTSLPLVYVFSIVLMVFGISIGTVTNPSTAAGAFVALLLTVPMLFVDRPFRIALLILCSDAIFVLLVILKKAPATWSNDLINACVFGPVSIIISSYMIRVKIQSYQNEEIISQLAKTDIMTGLKSRNCFEEKAKEYAVSADKNGFCIYVDVNGLHELNNTHGHAAGDSMLIFIAQELKTAFCHEDVYRMGGDEFLVCGSGKEKQDIIACVECFKNAVIEAGYYIAIGLEHRQSGIAELNEMMKEAERKMRQDKSLFYKTTGVDRRGRINAE